MKVHGLLLLDKPVGLSSNAALQRARRLFDAAKAGHGGTLDPLASGLLPVLFGEACKLATASLDGDKSYRARVRLGVRTSTDDAEGEVIERSPVAVDDDTLSTAMAGLRGRIEQVPPVYSALKRDGQPAYRLARQGRPPELAPRTVWIHALELEARAGDDLLLRVTCSKGTYVRALARDLGERLGCGAHLAGLERTRVGRFSLSDALTLSALEALTPESRQDVLVPLEALVEGWPRCDLDAAALAAFRLGQAVQPAGGLPVCVAANAGGQPARLDPAAADPSLGLEPEATGLTPSGGLAASTVILAVFHEGRLVGLARPDALIPGRLAPLRVLV